MTFICETLSDNLALTWEDDSLDVDDLRAYSLDRDEAGDGV